MIVATAGHIDHGKTALVQALTGVDTDRLPEEKSRGITIDLGFAYRPLSDGRVLGFVDVPGHERFVRNMLAGVSGIDFALLVVAADDGPKAQTLEHLAILDLLGVADGAVALTKTDIADEARIAQARGEIAALIANTRLEGVPVFPVSARTGAGIADLRDHIELVALDHAERAAKGHFRHAIDRVFTLAGAGLVVTGTAFAGTVKVGDRLIVSPSGIEARVRAIHAQNRNSETGAAGERLGINIAGPDVSKDSIRRGDWLVAEPLHAPVQRLDARLRLLTSEQKPLAHWTRVHAHLGAAEVLAHVALLERQPIPPGGEALAQIVLDEPVGALYGDRFILRDASATRTMAGGMVIDPFGPARGRARPERLAQIRAMAEPDADAALAALAAVSPAGVPIARFRQARNLADEGMAAVLAGAGGVVAGSDDVAVLFSGDAWEALAGQAVAALQASHEKMPDRPGVPEQALRRQLRPYLSPESYRALVETLIARGRALRSGPHLMLPGHQAEMTTADKALWPKAEAILGAAGFNPPVVHEMARQLGLEPKDTQKFLVRAERFGLVNRVADNRFYLAGHVRELAGLAETMSGQRPDGHIDITAFRDTAGIGRNLAVQLLEYFDRAGLTARLGDVRRVQRRAADIFPRPADSSE